MSKTQSLAFTHVSHNKKRLKQHKFNHLTNYPATSLTKALSTIYLHASAILKCKDHYDCNVHDITFIICRVVNQPEHYC